MGEVGTDLGMRAAPSTGKDHSMNNEPWASAEELAKHLGVAKDSIYRWIDNRGLPAHRIGRLWKFKLSEVDDWVRDGGTNSGSPGEGRS